VVKLKFDPVGFCKKLKRFFPDGKEDRHCSLYGIDIQQVSVSDVSDELEGIILM
jgi:hypothetical protein